MHFEYDEGNANHKLSVSVPLGVVSQIITNDKAIREEAYLYKDSALFYMAAKQPVQQDSSTLKQVAYMSDTESIPNNYVVRRGVDNDGCHWKVMTVGNLAVGYKRVPADKVQLFDNAISTMHIR